MKKALFTAGSLLAALGLAACGSQSGPELRRIDYAYSKPAGLGMYDPRATPAGTVYAWNTETGRLTAIGEVDLTTGTSSQPRTLTRTGLVGFGVSGLPLGDTKLVEARLRDQFSVTVRDSVRQPYYNSITALRDFVIARKAAGSTTDDINALFRPRDDTYRTVVFTAEERSSEVEVSAGPGQGEDSSASFRIELPGQEIVRISTVLDNSITCRRPEGGGGERPVCFTEVRVLDPFIQENGNISWRPVDDFSQAELSAALRQL